MAEDLSIGVVPGVSADTWARIWRERVPDVPLTVVQLAEDAAVAALGDGVDLVFARLPVPADADLNVIPLWTEVPVVVAAKDHPIKVVESVTLAELEDEDEQPGTDEATLDLVAAGHGIALMPQSVFRALGRRDLVGRPISDAATTRIALVWPPERSGPLIEEFIGIVRGRTANSSRGAAPPSPAPPATGAPAGRTRERPRTARRARKPPGRRTRRR